jgi:natural product precursor
MKKLQTTKLQLRTETVKLLDDKQLAKIDGGGLNPTVSCTTRCATYYTQCN